MKLNRNIQTMGRSGGTRFGLYHLSLLLLMNLFAVSAFAQSKTERQVLANARLLENTVFGSKDKATLEKLFATSLVYIHSSGRVENREQAIQGITSNRSTYKKLNLRDGMSISEKGDSMRVYQLYNATETKADGTSSELNISIETIWAKVKGKWLLFRRQARKAQ